MNVMLVCMKHNYGNSNRELSYEYVNFYETLLTLGIEVHIFDYMEYFHQLGKDLMNALLLNEVKEKNPDLVIFSLYTDQLDFTTIDSIRKYSKTFCFFHDDTWRVDFSRYWASHFDMFSSPDYKGIERYKEFGLNNCMYFPFGANINIYKSLGLEKCYDVSFVGAWSPYRNWIIKKLKRAGINVYTAGYRWPAGEISVGKMVDVFNKSAINLNVSNSASWDLRYLISSPRALANRIRTGKTVEQLKARTFEINACGGFQLSYYIDGIANCFDINKEIVVYADPDDLIDQIRFYIKRPKIRDSIAKAGHQRVLNDHTYTQRFDELFQRLGLAY